MSVISGTVGAVLGSDATTEAAQTSAQATQTAAQTAAQAQRDMFTAQQALNQPYLQASGYAIPQLQSAILGGPVSYADPRYTYDINTGQYRGPNGEMVATPPQITTTYNPKASPSYQYQQQALDRSLRAQGRSSGTYSGYLQGKLAAEDYDQQIARLSGLAGLGQGNTASLTAAAANTGNALSNLSMQTGQANSLAALMSGQAQANLYSGMGQASANAAAMGLQLYNYGQSAGWWGGGSAAASGAAADTAGSGLAAEYGAYAAA